MAFEASREVSLNRCVSWPGSSWLLCLAYLLVLPQLLPARAADLRIMDLRRVETNATWRIEWSSSPGLIYQLQRANNDALSVDGPTDWGCR